MIVHFLALNENEELILAASDISEAERHEGFFTGIGFIPPHFMFDTESEGLQVLHRLAEEIGLTVRSATH
jgi:hypothetical protein